MSFDFNSHYLSLQKVGERFEEERRKIYANRELSPEGKQNRIAELQKKLEADASKIQSEFYSNSSKLRESLQDTSTPRDRWEELIRKGKQKLLKDVGTYFNIIGDVDASSEDLRFLILANQFEELSRSIKQNSFSVQVSNMPPEQVRDLALKLFEAGDLETLAMLRDGTQFSHEEIHTAADYYITLINEQRMTPAQKRAKEELAALEKEIQLFDCSVQSLIGSGEFVDVRNNQGQVIDSSELAQIGRGR